MLFNIDAYHLSSTVIEAKNVISAEINSPAHTSSALVDGFGDNTFFVAPLSIVTSNILSGYVIESAITPPLVEVSSELLHGSMINASVEQPLPSIIAFSQLFTTASVQNPLPVVNSTVILGNVFTAEVVYSMPIVNAVIATGYMIDVDANSPLPDVFSNVESNNVITGNVLSLIPIVNSVVIGESFIDAQIVQFSPLVDAYVENEFNNIFTTYAMNLDNMQVTQYTNFGSLATAKINGTYLSITQDGIYSLGGDTDNGEQINARVRFGMDDMGSPNHKRVQYVYVGSRGTVSLQMLMDHDEISSIHNATHQDNGMGTRRIKLGKGNKSRYWQPEITGNRFEIDSMSIEAEVLSRKVA